MYQDFSKMRQVGARVLRSVPGAQEAWQCGLRGVEPGTIYLSKKLMSPLTYTTLSVFHLPVPVSSHIKVIWPQCPSHRVIVKTRGVNNSCIVGVG